MTIAAILAVVDGEAGSASVVDAAFRIGRRLDAYVEVLHVRPDPYDTIPLVGEGMSGAMVEQVMSDMRANAERNATAARRVFEEACATVDLPMREADSGNPPPGQFSVAWREVTGREDEQVSRRCLLFDLVMVGRPAEGVEGAYAPALEAALFDSVRPVFVVPPSLPDTIAQNVMIAWNGRREVARAIRAALPLMASAASVTVVTLDGETRGETADPDELAAYLALHGIEAHARRISDAASSGETLLAQASELGADLLVMGAYGHSRLREFIIGGATRTVLSSAAIPLLMAH